jgi:hypothetical protein
LEEGGTRFAYRSPAEQTDQCREDNQLRSDAQQAQRGRRPFSLEAAAPDRVPSYDVRVALPDIR